ncbi:MAG: 3-phosphoshikimate 1-carboxyvinyltransferase, partial [Armatimonadetes bacterium]|nr:3-phosphoshikimate 1-carboxyvinyltransferase [Armatimonadota bacterium]
RLLLGALAGRPFSVTLDGDASLRQRPMDRVAVPLSLMGAKVTGHGERCTPPVTVTGGPLQGIEYAMPIASAQVKSAILLAGLQAAGATTVIEPAPSRDHTERMLAAFGARIRCHYPVVSVDGGQTLRACEVSVPGDISSAAYLIAAALLVPGSELVIESVGVNPTRTGFLDILRETGFLDILRAMGAQIEIVDTRSGMEPIADIRASHTQLQGTEVGGELIPRSIDELPILAVLATQAEAVTVVRDAADLRAKECDRIATIAKGLQAMGADITPQQDGWIIHGPTPLRGAEIDAENDHRMAMCFAVAGLVASGETIIHGAQAIATSFPGFAEVLSSVGARVKQQ